MISQAKIRELLAKEQNLFRQTHTKCIAEAKRCAQNFLYGVPLHWMSDWASPVPLSLHQAKDAQFSCADRLQFYDFCLGDTAAMFGHSPPAVAKAIAEQANNGISARCCRVKKQLVQESY